MAMDDVGLETARDRNEFHHRADIADMRAALDGAAMHAETQARLDAGEGGRDIIAAKRAVVEKADFVPALGLLGGEIDDMTEQAAERRAEDMDNAQFAAVETADGCHRRTPGFLRGPAIAR